MRTDSDDNALAEAAGRGDREAFRRLLERHYDRIYALACRFTGSPDEAGDIAQDICCALPGKLRTYRASARFTTWLYRVALNACRDHYRRRHTRREREQAWAQVAAMRAAEASDDQARLEWLRQALAGLGEPFGETAVLVAGEGMSHREAAGVLGVSENTVSWRMHEVKKRLARAAKEA